MAKCVIALYGCNAILSNHFHELGAHVFSEFPRFRNLCAGELVSVFPFVPSVIRPRKGNQLTPTDTKEKTCISISYSRSHRFHHSSRAEFIQKLGTLIARRAP